jgi:hypothetical protein
MEPQALSNKSERVNSCRIDAICGSGHNTLTSFSLTGSVFNTWCLRHNAEKCHPLFNATSIGVINVG